MLNRAVARSGTGVPSWFRYGSRAGSPGRPGGLTGTGHDPFGLPGYSKAWCS